MTDKRRGLFVTLEGPDGSGKSTVAAGLRGWAEESGIDAVFTREPGGTAIAERIRDLILGTEQRGMDDRCEALLYAASRAEHTAKKIRPALEAGKLVVCDRYVLSSLAYQGCGRGLGIQAVSDINEFATGGLRPDLVIFLDVDPIHVLERKAREVAQDRLEEAGDDFHKRVYDGYQRALSLVENPRVVDARRTREEVLGDVSAIIRKAWEERA